MMTVFKADYVHVLVSQKMRENLNYYMKLFVHS